VTVHPAVRPTRSTRSTGWVPVALLTLALIPAIAGSLRLLELSGGPLLLLANPRLTASPAPVVAHSSSAVAYATLGAFQFSTALRRRHPGTSELTTDLSHGAGWAINLAVAEYVIRRHRSLRTTEATAKVRTP
jgi:hypothetical protein